jgi:hypothetical protein
MAQAKTRAPAKKRSTTRKRSQSTNSQNTKAKAARPRTKKVPARVQAVRKAVESTAKDAGHSVKDAGRGVGKVASKAKTPLLAGGAALAGAAGGMAVGAMRSRHSNRKLLGVKMPQPKRVKLRSRDVARAAKEVGSFGQHVGELATELRHVREENGNGAKHRSPVEVVLDGLTARR